MTEDVSGRVRVLQSLTADKLREWERTSGCWALEMHHILGVALTQADITSTHKNLQPDTCLLRTTAA